MRSDQLAFRPVMPGDQETCGCGKPVVAVVATEFGDTLICDAFRR